MAMPAQLGPYAMSRESSGTAWQPDSTPMIGIMGGYGEWSSMTSGYLDLVYDNQGGPRGETQTFAEGMAMGMATRPLGPGVLGLRAMLSPDPLMGNEGYPLLLQTGETPDGSRRLIDRQHPHDLLMELSASYSAPVSDEVSLYGYVGYPGEPALGPPTFMHRYSGFLNPEAPIDHHWLDSTHIVFGVATFGVNWRDVKLEGSLFNGQEPDQKRYNFDDPAFDSQALRLSWNPSPNWALQVSRGWLASPEQLEPDTDQRRTTASAIYNLPFYDNNWQTTLAWGRNDMRPGRSLDAWLLESALTFHETHTIFARAEEANKDELFDSGPLEGEPYHVGKLSLGYLYETPISDHVKTGIGGLGSVYAIPEAIEPAYGNNPTSFMLFTRFSLY